MGLHSRTDETPWERNGPMMTVLFLAFVIVGGICEIAKHWWRELEDAAVVCGVIVLLYGLILLGMWVHHRKERGSWWQ